MPTEPERTVKIRHALSELRERCESLRVRAEESQPVIGQANALVVKRDAGLQELRSTQTAERRSCSVAQAIDDYNQEIRRLTESLAALRADLKTFAADLTHLLRLLPLGRKDLLEIRSEIFEMHVIRQPLKPFPDLALRGVNRDLDVLDGRLQDLAECLGRGSGRQYMKNLISPIEVPPETKWEDLSLRFISDERVQLLVRGNPSDTRNFAEMGFEDRRRPGVSTMAWEFFCRLAEAGPEGIPRSKFSGRAREKAEKRIGEIRKGLRQLFPKITGDPFESVRIVKSYKLKLRINFPGSDRL